MVVVLGLHLLVPRIPIVQRRGLPARGFWTSPGQPRRVGRPWVDSTHAVRDLRAPRSRHPADDDGPELVGRPGHRRHRGRIGGRARNGPWRCSRCSPCRSSVRGPRSAPSPCRSANPAQDWAPCSSPPCRSLRSRCSREGSPERLGCNRLFGFLIGPKAPSMSAERAATRKRCHASSPPTIGSARGLRLAGLWLSVLLTSSPSAIAVRVQFASGHAVAAQIGQPSRASPKSAALRSGSGRTWQSPSRLPPHAQSQARPWPLSPRASHPNRISRCRWLRLVQRLPLATGPHSGGNSRCPKLRHATTARHQTSALLRRPLGGSAGGFAPNWSDRHPADGSRRTHSPVGPVRRR